MTPKININGVAREMTEEEIERLQAHAPDSAPMTNTEDRLERLETLVGGIQETLADVDSALTMLEGGDE